MSAGQPATGGPSLSPGIEAVYREDPQSPGYWFYRDLRIQADLETHQAVVAHALKHLPRGTSVLDVAAGQGALAQQLIDAGYDVSCTSWNDECRAPATVYRVDLEQPFSVDAVGGRRYPLVCCIEIIEHLENPFQFLRNCADLVEPGGRLLLSTPNVESAAARLQWLIRGSPLIFSGDEVTRNRHISMMWREGLEYLIGLAGFTIAERHFLGSFPPNRGPLSTIKRLVYALMQATLAGDTRGTTRLYVLRPSGRSPRRPLADEAY